MTPHDHPEQVIWSHRRRGDYRYLWRVPYTARGAHAWPFTLWFRARWRYRQNAWLFRRRTYVDKLRRLDRPHHVRIGFDATSLTAAGKGIARFQREFLRAAAAHGLVEQLDVFVPEQPDEDALPVVEGWRYHRVPTRPMVVWEQFRLPRLARRLGLDVVITASERAALWGPPEVVYIYEHPAPPRPAQPRGRDLAPAAARRLDHAAALPGRDAARRRRARRLRVDGPRPRPAAPVHRRPLRDRSRVLPR